MEYNIQEKIQEYWSIASQKYGKKIRNELTDPYCQRWLLKIMRFTPPCAPLDVLDVGTGPGFFSIILSKAGHRVVAIDCSDQMLVEAVSNARFAGVDPAYIKMDAHKLDFANSSFDIIISRNLAWTLYDPLAAYAEWKRVLRPYGEIIIFDANYGNYCFNEQIAIQKMENEEKYYKIYGVSHKTNTISDEYIKEMFLSNKQRPEWDIEAFESFGMSVYSETNVGGELYNDDSVLLNLTSPLFMVVAEKEK
jgi:SAM-dependent methyltransferase